MLSLKEKIKIWAALPVSGKKIASVAFDILLFATIACVMCIRQLDADSFYMIRTGRDIINNGFPEYNPYVFVENQKFPIQQWLYCIIMATIYDLLGQTGILLFGAAQALLLYTLIRRKLSNAIDDGVWTRIAALLPCIASIGYFMTVRPENMTLSLLMIDGLLIDKYEQTKKPVYLYIIPIVVMIEMNMHASMWVFHFCILAAYLFPNVLKAITIPSNLKMNKHVLIMIIMMIAALFANPNGIGIITYSFKSLDTFQYVPIIEQRETAILTLQGVVFTTMIITVTAMLIKKTITSTTLHISLGFLLLSAANYHSSMFMIIAVAYVMTDLSKYIASKSQGKKLSDTMNNATWTIFPLMLACIIATNHMAYDMGYATYYMSIPELDNITDYIKKNDEDLSSNILNELDAGSYLEFKGLSRLYCDSRPEMLSSKINKNKNMVESYALMEYGIPTKTLGPKTVEEFLDTYDIEYIILYERKTSWPVLKHYLDNTDDYKKVDHMPKQTETPDPIYNDTIESSEPSENEPKFALYERSKT